MQGDRVLRAPPDPSDPESMRVTHRKDHVVRARSRSARACSTAQDFQNRTGEASRVVDLPTASLIWGDSKTLCPASSCGAQRERRLGVLPTRTGHLMRAGETASRHPHKLETPGSTPGPATKPRRSPSPLTGGRRAILTTATTRDGVALRTGNGASRSRGLSPADSHRPAEHLGQPSRADGEATRNRALPRTSPRRGDSHKLPIFPSRGAT